MRQVREAVPVLGKWMWLTAVTGGVYCKLLKPLHVSGSEQPGLNSPLMSAVTWLDQAPCMPESIWQAGGGQRPPLTMQATSQGACMVACTPLSLNLTDRASLSIWAAQPLLNRLSSSRATAKGHPLSSKGMLPKGRRLCPDSCDPHAAEEYEP